MSTQNDLIYAIIGMRVAPYVKAHEMLRRRNLLQPMLELTPLKPTPEYPRSQGAPVPLLLCERGLIDLKTFAPAVTLDETTILIGPDTAVHIAERLREAVELFPAAKGYWNYRIKYFENSGGFQVG